MYTLPPPPQAAHKELLHQARRLLGAKLALADYLQPAAATAATQDPDQPPGRQAAALESHRWPANAALLAGLPLVPPGVVQPGGVTFRSALTSASLLTRLAVSLTR